MNRSYRPLWNDATQRCAPAPETVRGAGQGRPGMALAPLALLLGALLAPAAGALPLPKGEQVVAGQARISRDGNHMTITQTTPKAIVHWQGFDIGKNSHVHFDQPGAHAIALNRVVAGNASKINGQLSANGQVWLVNPNGVVFGKGSSVNVGGLVASTLDITNEDFGAGRQLFTRGAAQGGITNHGAITVADGATLALLAPTVNNNGKLNARLGNVVLAGGDKVTLHAGVDGRLQVGVSPATVRTLLENNQLIMADGGQVVMTASAADALSASMVSNAGTVQARTLENRQGRIMLLGDIRHGEAGHSGVLDASAPESGHGGFVNTVAAKLRINKGARITTAAKQGNPGLWESISKGYLFIHAGDEPEPSGLIGSSFIASDTLAASLANGNVELHAQAPYARRSRILLVTDLPHDRNRLTLNSDHDITIAMKSVEGTGTLHLNYGGTAGSADAVAAAGSKLSTPGWVKFAKSGTGLLRINGHDFEVIRDLATLQSLGQENRLGGNYALGQSLDASNVDFEPIGNDAKTFTGTFDGLGHSITNLTIRRADRNAVGLFGRTTNATLRNVTLAKVQVTGKDSVGGLVGAHLAIGAAASISDSQVNGTVEGQRAVGGLVGLNLAQGGTASLSDVKVEGRVVGGAKEVSATGGLVGINQAHGGMASIVKAHADAQVTGEDCVGGLVGVNQAIAGTASIRDVFAAGDASGRSSIGALIGKNEVASRQGTVDIADALAMGKVTGVQPAGELIGENQIAEGGISRISKAQYWPLPKMLRPGGEGLVFRSGALRAFRALSK